MTSLVSPADSRRAQFVRGLRATIPLVIGAMPFGVIFGALAITSGLSPAAALAMSAFVFAGASQFIGVGLVASVTPLPIIWLTTLVVNLRHALYSASLAPYVRHLPQRWLIPLGFWLTDETYLVTIANYEAAGDVRHKHYFYFGSAIFMYLNWQLCTLVGVVFGASVQDPARWGLDFAMSATFIGMLIPSVRGRPVLAAVLTGAIVAVAAYSLPYKLGLMLATLCGVAAGVLAERRWGGGPPHTLHADADEEARMAIEETR
jgi:4-azaleucine resistance transporter AzlC